MEKPLSAALSTVAALGDYLGGGFVLPTDDAQDGSITRHSPRDLDDLVIRVPVRAASVDEAVVRARAAFPAWSRAALALRKERLLALREALARHTEELALAITREVGKPLWEARTEVAAALNKVDITLSDGLALVEARQMAPGQRYEFRPLGVAAVLGPFNFPLHLTHGHVVPLLATGNCVVIKGSELTPLVSQLYAQCLDEAGFPAGVVNVVQGGAAQGARLAAHPDVDGVMLTGSARAGHAIKQATLHQPHKLLALELGGRNPAIVLADADLGKATHDVLWGALVTAGQRCSGTAVALVDRALYAPFVDSLRVQLRDVVVGDPLAPGVFMGPLVSEAARARYVQALEQAERAGVELLATGTVEATPRGAYVAPTIHVLHQPQGLSYEREELFGPDLAIELVDDLQHAVRRANQSPYGLAASVFTRDQAAFDEAFATLRYGCVNLNAPTCGASSRLPFGGTRDSGNHRPAALFSTLYATYPVASITGPGSLDPSTLSPGFRRG